MFLKILRNSLESTSVRVSFSINLQAWGFIKKRLWYRCFPVKFAKFLGTSFFTCFLCFVLVFFYKFSKILSFNFVFIIKSFFISKNFLQYLTNIFPTCKLLSSYQKQPTRGVLSKRYCFIFSEHFFLRTPLMDCFSPLQKQTSFFTGCKYFSSFQNFFPFCFRYKEFFLSISISFNL